MTLLIQFNFPLLLRSSLAQPCWSGEPKATFKHQALFSCPTAGEEKMKTVSFQNHPISISLPPGIMCPNWAFVVHPIRWTEGAWLSCIYVYVLCCVEMRTQWNHLTTTVHDQSYHFSPLSLLALLPNGRGGLVGWCAYGRVWVAFFFCYHFPPYTGPILRTYDTACGHAGHAPVQ